MPLYLYLQLYVAGLECFWALCCLSCPFRSQRYASTALCAANSSIVPIVFNPIVICHCAKPFRAYILSTNQSHASGTSFVQVLRP